MLLASGASIPTIAGTVEEEEEYARSEANSAHYDGYVTDHTDLASEIDIDESEYRRELLNDKWRMLFDKFDPEGFGEIPVEDFLAALKSAEWKTEIPPNKRDILLTRAKESRVEAVTFQDFVNVLCTLTRRWTTWRMSSRAITSPVGKRLTKISSKHVSGRGSI
ncbi:rhomboid-related protein 3-like isoform X3 [Apis florea]|uniref:rhomboid-related protein 3-like isoform X3 n=1 Tax=Apis florea TaxID=7463 RepID=UPI0006290296|nr:rhomboid-related protein 3-like isoform X3 [Apis florea]